ncbi:hypothetical protein KJ359_000332 [Pestalotiopsis sp. 9143b]|nr:hypothetical protein KJ359_000332 [Pestalotiopsis sp. 9143b]
MTTCLTGCLTEQQPQGTQTKDKYVTIRLTSTDDMNILVPLKKTDHAEHPDNADDGGDADLQAITEFLRNGHEGDSIKVGGVNIILKA